MSESIFVRVQRVIATGAHGGLDAVERLSGASLMRQALREVDRAAEDLRTEAEVAKGSKARAAAQQQQIRERLVTLDEQARFTLSKGREDLAEAVVARQIELEERARQLAAAQVQAEKDIAGFAEALEAVGARRSQMQKELAAFEAAQTDAAASSAAAAASPEQRSEQRIARAEAAFERAMNAAGLAVGLAAPDKAAQLAEVDALQKEAAIAERLEALKAKAAKAASRPKANRSAA
jgi:phage shock protein A